MSSSLKGSEHYIASLYSVTSNGELINGYLWNSVVFRNEVIFPRIWFRDLRVRFWGLEIKHLRAHNLCNKGVFLSLFSRNCDDQLSSNFHRFDISICICWDTPSEKTGLWQLLVVSTAFNNTYFSVCST